MQKTEETFLPISAGLRDALRRVRHKSKTTTLWIDQLSIDQQNLEERNFQVSGMRRFYNRAQHVRVWIGEQDEHTDTLFDILRKLAAVQRLLEYSVSADELLGDTNLDLPSLESDIWTEAVSLLMRPVFGRCWVIQEVVVATRISLQCGEYNIAWEDAASAAKILFASSSSPSWIKRSHNSKNFHHASRSASSGEKALEPEISSIVPHLVTINGLREDFHSLRRVPLEELLYMTSVFGATDSRDRIYALLGIRVPNIDPYSSEKDLLPDYNKPVADVFIQATKVCILESGSLDICGMHTSMSDKVVNGPPSWVPDYSSSADSVWAPFSRPQPNNPYHASGDSELVAVWPDDQRPDLLTISAYHIDTLVEVSGSYPDDTISSIGLIIDEWSHIAAKGRAYGEVDFIADAFWRTCVGDQKLHSRQSLAPDS